MGRVASFGSVNRDLVASVDARTLAALTDRYDWFPAAGETRRVEALPDPLDAHVTEELLGGKGANQAVAAAAAGADAGLHAKVGEEAVRDQLADRGVDVAGVATVDAPTGTAYVAVAPDGENHIAILGGANDAVDPAFAREQLPAVGATDALLVQNEVPPAATTGLLDGLADLERRPTVVLDPAPAEGAAPLLEHPCVDLVTPNETEAAALGAELDAFDGVVVRTHGSGPVVVEAGGERFEVAPPPADPVDTTGAGDVFAGYLAAALAERPPGERLDTAALRKGVEIAAAAASLSVEAAGVQRATPDRGAVDERRG